MDDIVFQVDASPWGGGATLRVKGKIIEYWWCIWETKSVAHLKVQTGLPKHHTFLGGSRTPDVHDCLETPLQQRAGIDHWRQYTGPTEFARP